MAQKKKKRNTKEKGKLHPRNKHHGRYNLKELTDSCPDLTPFVILNDYDDETIDFANPVAVKMLNKALLQHYYKIENWDIPENYLCPPIPGRADYIHHIADLLATSNQGEIPKGNLIKCLDIGVGANCVYPIIGRQEYGWNFIGSDIDPVSIQSATEIVNANPNLKSGIKFRLQPNYKNKIKMPSVKNLKKDINYVLGDIIEAVYLFEMSTTGKPTAATNALIDEAISTFDTLITKVNAKKVENKKAHFKQINTELEQAANQLVTKINDLQ